MDIYEKLARTPLWFRGENYPKELDLGSRFEGSFFSGLVEIKENKFELNEKSPLYWTLNPITALTYAKDREAFGPSEEGIPVILVYVPTKRDFERARNDLFFTSIESLVSHAVPYKRMLIICPKGYVELFKKAISGKINVMGIENFSEDVLLELVNNILSTHSDLPEGKFLYENMAEEVLKSVTNNLKSFTTIIKNDLRDLEKSNLTGEIIKMYGSLYNYVKTRWRRYAGSLEDQLRFIAGSKPARVSEPTGRKFDPENARIITTSYVRGILEPFSLRARNLLNELEESLSRICTTY